MKIPLFEMRTVCFAYPGQSILFHDLNFSFCNGQKTGLIGANGTGKTTLAFLLMGLLQPTSGTILHRGNILKKEKEFLALRREVGLVFQNAEDQLFYPTVLDDVAFGPLNIGKTAQQARELAKKALDEAGLTGFEQRLTHRLSGGEKKLVALATILAMEPQAVILDEPSNDLAPAMRSHLIHILDNLGLARIIISHDYDFLEKTTDQIYALSQGKISFTDTTTAHEHVHVHAHGKIPHNHGGAL